MKKPNIKKVIFATIILFITIGAIVFGISSLLTNDKMVDSTQKSDTPKAANEFSNVSYYRSENLKRYQTYQNTNPNASIEDIVTHVNMGIDVPFYSQDPIIVDNPEDLEILINKVYKLPDDWEPTDLEVVDNNGQKMRKVAAKAYQELKADCDDAGFILIAHSGYRSTAYQKEIYENMIRQYGAEYTDKYSSRPGQSEHTTGLCVDISIDGIPYTDIENSQFYEIFKEKLEEYGFIIRYPDGKEDLTGYHYESWHIRYLGKELAKKVNASGLTYDEYVARLN